MKTDVISLENKKTGTIDLNDNVFGVDVRSDILARVVNWQRAKARSGTHQVKGRGEVAATKAKPFRQKGGGRARQGTTVAPQMRGGGVVFGPHVRDHSHKLPKKVRNLGLRTALSAKKASGQLFVLESLDTKKSSTSMLAKKLKKLGWNKALLIDGKEINEKFSLAARNIVGFDVLPSHGANVFDILRRETLIITKAGVQNLEERLK